MIDFHNHSIPKLDDGPKNIETAINMYRHAKEQGITDVINTVHFQHPKMKNKNTSYEHISSEIKKFNKILKGKDININIHIASEVYYLPNLTEILDNPITTFGNKKYMLIEFETMILPKNYKEEIFKLMLKDVTPIIAHPERYRFVQSNLSLVEDWINLGYIIQIDCGSILGDFGKEVEKVSHLLIRKNLCHLIGSDAHNDKKRNFCLKKALDKLNDLLDSQSINKILNNSKSILIGNDCERYINKKNNNILKKIMFKLGLGALYEK
jgi:protein-tyrosine phosphatase